MPGARVASGERVTLRTVEREDVPFLQRPKANPELRYPLGWDVKNRAQVEADFEDDFGGDDLFLVCLDGDDAGHGSPDEDAVRRIGLVVVTGPEWGRPELGFFVVPEVHGEGYGTEAVSLVVDYVFRVNAHPAVEARAFPDNEASRGLLESLGFTREGRIRKALYWDGEYRDAIQYGLLRGEWRDRD